MLKPWKAVFRFLGLRKRIVRNVMHSEMAWETWFIFDSCLQCKFMITPRFLQEINTESLQKNDKMKYLTK